MKPLIVVDLAPKFNIPDKESDIVNKYYSTMNSKLNINDDDYFKIFVYKNPLEKKYIVINDEESYNSIIRTVENIDFTIHKYMNHCSDIGILFLGKFVEYQFINTILNKYYPTNSNIISVKLKPIYNYIEDKENFDEKINKDITKIKKYMKKILN